MSEKDKKKDFPKPRREADKQTVVIPSKKDKDKRPARKQKHKKKLCCSFAEFLQNQTLVEKTSPKREFDDFKEWKYAVEKLTKDQCSFDSSAAGRKLGKRGTESETAWLTRFDADEEDDVVFRIVGKWNAGEESGWVYETLPKAWLKESLLEATGPQFFVVLASVKKRDAPRGNGSALVKAENKAEARRIAKNNWLENGSVDSVHVPTDERVSDFFEEGELAKFQKKIEAKIKKGNPPIVEIEWGT